MAAEISASPIVEQSVRPAATAQLANKSPALARTVTYPMQVKRKPIPSAISGNAVLAASITPQNVPDPIPGGSRPGPMNVPEAKSLPVTTQAPQSRAQTFPVPVAPTQPQYTPTLRSWEQFPRPGLVLHAQTEPSPRSISQVAKTVQPQRQTIPVQQKAQQRPQLQQHYTAPPLSSSQGNIARGLRASNHQSASTVTKPKLPINKRMSVSNVFTAANAKKLAKNKWVRKGAKMAVKAVVTGDIVATLTSSYDDDNGSGNGDANTTDDDGIDFGAGADDPTADFPASDTGSLNGIDGGGVTGSFDNWYSASATGDPNADWTDPNAGNMTAGSNNCDSISVTGDPNTGWSDPNTGVTDPGADLIDANPNPSIFDNSADFVPATTPIPSPGLDPTATDPTADASYFNPDPSYTNLDDDITDPNAYYATPASPTYSQVDQNTMAEYDNTQDGLLSSEEGLDGAIGQSADDAMNEGDAVDADMQNNLYASIGEGDPAEPDGECSDQEYDSDPSGL